MKARFDQTPFRPLSLRPADCQRYTRLADELLRGVLSEYDHFGPPPAPRVFSKSRWKVVRTHETFTVYQDRAKSAPSPPSTGASDASPQYAMTSASLNLSDLDRGADDDEDDSAVMIDEGADWKMPELVISGVVPGTLEDVLYGMTTHDSADMMLRTAYVDDSWLDAAVLCPIERPTPADPFRFLGVKWYVRGMPKKYSGVVLPRDFVFLEASGVLTRADGSRVGYFLRHPVVVPGCPELAEHGIVRGRFTNYSIYTPLPELGAVDIFVRGKASPAGKMALSIAVALTASSLLSASNAVFCSHSKKLTWLLRHAAVATGPARAAAKSAGDGPVLAETSRRCVVCLRRFGKLSSVVACSVCGERICSRCRLARSLSYVDTRSNSSSSNRSSSHRSKRRGGGLRVQEIAGTFCRTCVSTANNASALEIARAEVLSGRYGPVAAATDRDSTTTSAQQHNAPAAGAAPILINAADDDVIEAAIVGTPPDSDDVSPEAAWEHDNEMDELRCTESGGDSAQQHEWVPAIPYAGEVQPQSADLDAQQQRQELWRKMTELREQAEHVYALAKQTSALHLAPGGSGSNSIEQYDSEVDDLD
ncbi:hypothetical protein PybrP1_005264 [[Pythium] brassicae (nom. inval.)]|nr:hypothetical protein PybrP1_005264 [[Pythium] brassicae (nom. inval.)]